MTSKQKQPVPALQLRALILPTCNMYGSQQHATPAGLTRGMWVLTRGLCCQEVTPRIYHLFKQSPWWHRYTASQPQPQPYFTVLLSRKDMFTPAASFQLHPFMNSAMGKQAALSCVC